MSYKVLLAKPALNMIAEHRDDIALRSEHRAEAWVRDLLQVIREQLAVFPRMAPQHPATADESIRRWVWRNYIVIYRVVDTPGIIQVLSVRHARQERLTEDHM